MVETLIVVRRRQLLAERSAGLTERRTAGLPPATTLTLKKATSVQLSGTLRLARLGIALLDLREPSWPLIALTRARR